MSVSWLVFNCFELLFGSLWLNIVCCVIVFKCFCLFHILCVFAFLLYCVFFSPRFRMTYLPLRSTHPQLNFLKVGGVRQQIHRALFLPLRDLPFRFPRRYTRDDESSAQTDPMPLSVPVSLAYHLYRRINRAVPFLPQHSWRGVRRVKGGETLWSRRCLSRIHGKRRVSLVRHGRFQRGASIS